MISHPQLQLLKFIPIIFIVSQLVFMLIGLFAGPVVTAVSLDETQLQILPPAIGTVALMMTFAIPIARKAMMGKFCLPFINEGNSGRVSDDFDHSDPDNIQAAQQELNKTVPKYFTGTLIGLAFSEAICITGLALSQITGQPILVLPFFAWSLLCTLVQWPNDNAINSLLSPTSKAIIKHHRAP